MPDYFMGYKAGYELNRFLLVPFIKISCRRHCFTRVSMQLLFKQKNTHHKGGSAATPVIITYREIERTTTRLLIPALKSTIASQIRSVFNQSGNHF